MINSLISSTLGVAEILLIVACAAIVIGAIVTAIVRKVRGKTSCGGSCGCCDGCSHCNKEK